MKKIIAILLVAVMALSIAACAPAGGDATYAIVCKDASNPYMLRMISGFEEACKALGVKSVTKSPETATVDGQIQIVNELVAQGVKGIAIAANDAAALEATIKSATDAGIVVVTLDSLALRLGIHKLALIADDFGNVALGAVLRVIGAGLQRADHADLSALGKETMHKISLLTPSNTVDEIRFAHALLVGKPALHGDAEIAYRYAGRRGAILGISSQVAD